MKFLIALILALPLSAQTPLSVSLAWMDLLNPAGTTYNVYRAPTACTGTPAYVKLTAAPITPLAYSDTSATSGTYCYYVTAVVSGVESAPSVTAQASLPFAPTGTTGTPK